MYQTGTSVGGGQRRLCSYPEYATDAERTDSVGIVIIALISLVVSFLRCGRLNMGCTFSLRFLFVDITC